MHRTNSARRQQLTGGVGQLRRRRLLAVAGLAIAPTLLLTLPTSSAQAVQGASTSTRSTTVPKATYNSKCQKTAQTQIALDECAAKEVAELTKELNSALAIEGRVFGLSLVASVQERWAAFEKAECTLESSPNKGGTIYPLVYGLCERTLLVQRIDDIGDDVSSQPQ